MCVKSMTVLFLMPLYHMLQDNQGVSSTSWIFPDRGFLSIALFPLLGRFYSVEDSRKLTVPRVASSSVLTPMGIVIWG